MKKCNWPNLIFNWFFGVRRPPQWDHNVITPGSVPVLFPNALDCICCKNDMAILGGFFCYGFDLDMHEREVFLWDVFVGGGIKKQIVFFDSLIRERRFIWL